jgi:decaprenylphospho-beta-D-erythro-pentofuranosid-2-ulose 2-reductase
MADVLIIGATSGIAQAVARLYAEQGASFVLLARNAGRLEAVAADLRVRGADDVLTIAADLSQPSEHARLGSEIARRMPDVDVALLAYGVLPDQTVCERSFTDVHEAIRVNYGSALSWLTLLANAMEPKGKGVIAVLSSVAGDRGRRSNYVYGSTKAGLDVFLSGLRARLARSGVHVLTVKPGFVDTPMTAHLRKGFLFASPARVARGILKGIRRRRNVIYVPAFWRPILWAVRTLPEGLFKRLRA